MTLFVKICGITSEAGAEAAAESGADALGFVFARSPRRLTPEKASELAAVVPGHIEKVAVFLRPTHREIEEILASFPADTVQADAACLDGFTTTPVLPVLREATRLFDGQRILFEGPRSGVGVSADRAGARETASGTRLILAGGLTPSNVRAAVSEVRPFGVDVSSGVESSLGVKDPHLIREFIAEVRASEKDEVVTI